MTRSTMKNAVETKDLQRLSPFAREVAKGLINAIGHVKGEKSGARETAIELPEAPPAYAPSDVREVRTGLGMTQATFARLMNVSVKSVEGWEAGTKKPSPPSRRLIQIASDQKTLSILTRVAGRHSASGAMRGKSAGIPRNRVRASRVEGSL